LTNPTNLAILKEWNKFHTYLKGVRKMKNIYIVIEYENYDEFPVYYGAFFSKESAEMLALKLSKEYWSRLVEYKDGVFNRYPHAGLEDSWYMDQNFRVQEIELKD
jgi:hypothetical protein